MGTLIPSIFALVVFHIPTGLVLLSGRFFICCGYFCTKIIVCFCEFFSKTMKILIDKPQILWYNICVYVILHTKAKKGSIYYENYG